MLYETKLFFHSTNKGNFLFNLSVKALPLTYYNAYTSHLFFITITKLQVRFVFVLLGLRINAMHYLNTK